VQVAMLAQEAPHEVEEGKIGSRGVVPSKCFEQQQCWHKMFRPLEQAARSAMIAQAVSTEDLVGNTRSLSH